MGKLLTKLLEKWLSRPLEKLARHIERWSAEADAARQAEQSAQGEGAATPAQADGPSGIQPSASPASSAYPLGLASCWDGPNASRRMMNALSPKMPDAKFREYVAWMLARGCTHAHVILANGGDGEYAGYAAWRDADFAAMLARYNELAYAGLRPVPWIVTDDSAALIKELFAKPSECVGKCAAFLDSAPYVVLGLEMDEAGGAANWAAVRDAVRKRTKAPIGVHHTSGNEFRFANLGDIILGQLDPGCTEAQVRAQIARIRALGKRAVGFEYARGPARALALAALDAGAEGVGNWDGGALPTTNANSVVAPAPAQGAAEDSVDFGLLNWDYGGFKGGGAKLDAKARIYNLQVKSSGMSYRWMSGGCENLGCSSATDAHCLACLFCLIDGKWVGGKFDWISTSRTSRDFENIKGGYKGWPANSIAAARKFAFVIVSENGARRTNVIACGK